jgi:hypothetical protein
MEIKEIKSRNRREGRKMKIHLRPFLVLTDEHPKAGKGKPVLVDYETWKVYHHGDMIGVVSAQQAVSLAVKERGENDFLPEEIHFISRFKAGDHESQSAGEEVEVLIVG